MHKQTLREISKFASGLVVADFLCGLWLYTSHLLPMSFFGINVTQRGAVVGMVTDVIVFAFLVHYGWRMKDRPRTKGERKFHVFIGSVFGLVALLHLSRLVFGWQFTIGGWEVPYWLNGLGAVVTALLSYISFALQNRL